MLEVRRCSGINDTIVLGLCSITAARQRRSCVVPLANGQIVTLVDGLDIEPTADSFAPIVHFRRRLTMAHDGDLKRVAGNDGISSILASSSSVSGDDDRHVTVAKTTLQQQQPANNVVPTGSRHRRVVSDTAATVVRCPSGTTIADRTKCWPQPHNENTGRMGMWNPQEFNEEGRTQQTAASRLANWLSK